MQLNRASLLGRSSGVLFPKQLATHHPRRCPSQRRNSISCAAVGLPEMLDAITQIAQHAPLAYEPVALPCSLMNCGDAVYRSTLDLQARGEVRGLDWRGVLLLASIAVYLFIPPGVVPALLDYYILSRLQKGVSYNKQDIVMGRKLGGGGFGVVYQAQLKEKNGRDRPLIVKKAKEFGEAEVWMNERMMRVGGNHVAPFITAFDERSTEPRAAASENNAIWLIWADEQATTLSDLLQKKEFPLNMEPLLFGRTLDNLEKGQQRKLVVIKLLMRQLFEALGACHSTGIVHRDVKPANLIISANSRKLKFIDLGAAADLRIGINYVPNEYLLDPRYAPPQQYVMSTRTVAPPPAPVAALLSPVLWFMEQPDKFDMYSAGVTLLQFIFPPLRNDDRLIVFNKKFQASKCDLRLWRKEEERKGNKEYQEGFELLDLDGAAGFDLLQSLLSFNPRDRPSVADALQHPWFGGLSLSSVMRSAGRFVRADMMEQALLTATYRDGGLSEADLAEQLGLGEQRPGVAPLDTRKTLAWWSERQEALRRATPLPGGAIKPAPGAAVKPLPAAAGKGKVAAVAPKKKADGKRFFNSLF